MSAELESVNLDDYLPKRVNAGPWLTAYTLHELSQIDPKTEIVLPICSIGTPYSELTGLGDLMLPPLYHEALDPSLKERILEQIFRCFPEHVLCRDERPALAAVRVVAVGVERPVSSNERPTILAFSVDTAVEQHGPHLPLATDTIQSYAVLKQLAAEFRGLSIGRPLDYGQLTWGLPFGFSVDLTAELLRDYVTRYVNAMLDWISPEALYVADVHGSIVHRQTIVDGLRNSRCERWAFRWLHEPLAEFASQRGDQHAGGVETALVERVSRGLLDPSWWPTRIDEIAAGQMPFATAVELSSDLKRFVSYVNDHAANGVIGDIRNYRNVDAELMFGRMMSVARSDVESLLGSRQDSRHEAGQSLW